ncbi:MAG: hypothetical protein JXB49_06845 [Bacteroidales bacterium]|nr:hypothetical protein [Bacteroidales bacterium]
MKMKNFFVSILLAAISFGCNMENTSTSIGLTVEDSYFATENEDGYLEKAPNNTFKAGENINMVLINVSGFKKGEDGLNSFEMEMEVYDSEGKLILSLGNLLGEGGHISLENNIAESPYASLTSTENLQPGTYKWKLSIYDNISGGHATESKTFTIE